MSQPTWRYGLAAVLAAWLVDLFFWQTPPGVSFFLWTIAVLAAGMLLARGEGVRPSPWSSVLILASLVFSAITFLRSESFTQFLGFTLTLTCLAVLAATFRTGNWIVYRIWDYIKAFFRLVGGVLLRPFELVRRPAAASEASSGPAVPTWRSTGRTLRSVLVGLVLALPVLLLLGALLASADPIFADRLSALLAIFDINRLAEYLFRLTYILILAFILSGVYLHAILPTALEARPDPASPWLKPFLGSTEATVVLVCVDLLFGLFVGIQFWYFFGGQANITATGYTYADYARRGFFELVAVAVISLVLYLGLSTITHRETPRQRLAFTGLSVLLMAMVMVMLVSAFQRMLLYEQAYGFTHLRLYTHIFIIWLGILLAAAMVFELTHHSYRFGLALALTILGFGLTFGFYNVDAAIASQNIERARAGSSLDATYLASLSPDGTPVLLEEYRRPDQPEAIHDALGAELACRTARVRQNPLPWQGINLAENNARNLLLLNQAEWSAYPVSLNERVWQVRVNGKLRSCASRTFVD